MKRYLPPEISEEPLVPVSTLLTASNEGYDLDEFNPGFLVP